MKYMLAAAVLSTAMVSYANNEVDPAYFEITGMNVREIPVAPGHQILDTVGIGSVDCSSSPASLQQLEDATDILGPLNALEMVVDKIINIGKKIWDIVQAGKPVVNIKTDIATALPLGARCWADLQGWQMPETRVYEVGFKNGFGMEVVKMSYRVMWLPGGTVDGVGQYIGYASMAPVDIKVQWGFSLNANVSIPTVFNMGSKEAPIGGMQMNMGYRVESPITTIDQGQAFFVDGRGQFKKLD